MSRAQMIKKIIGEAIQEYGFEYTHSKDGYAHIYTFLRKKEDLEQRIWIDIEDTVTMGNVISMSFMTNAYGQKEVHASNLIESDFKGDDEGLVFKDDEELKQILYHFKEIILQKGFDILEEISKPTTEARPKRETHWKLYQEHEALNEEYRKGYGLEETESTVKLIRKISDIILENKDKEFAEVEEMLIGLAAVYSDQLIRKCGGEWKWNDNFGTGVIKYINGRDTVNPLATVIDYWKRRKDDYDYWFINDFKKTASDVID